MIEFIFVLPTFELFIRLFMFLNYLEQLFILFFFQKLNEWISSTWS